MAEPKKTEEKISGEAAAILIKLNELEAVINIRFDKLKQIVIDYLNLGNEMARASVVAALKSV